MSDGYILAIEKTLKQEYGIDVDVIRAEKTIKGFK